ncbi:MAG TPA: SDR family oxidoreductase [Flavobacterium sp.]|jgi:NAD(P)-dependent dehydrogenase (short-subunit alcohol dehydrogenase family)
MDEITSADPFSLSGKKFLVTGASSGIGNETCRSIVRQGGSFIAVARREDFLKNLVEEVGGDNLYIIADLSDLNDIRKVVQEIPSLDGLVHSAGIAGMAPLKFYNEEEMNRMRIINFDSIVHLVSLMSKHKKINKAGSIVLVSSIAASFGTTGNGIYAATKGALLSIANVWANELAKMKIRVNSVSPGMVRTEITTQFINNLSSEVVDIDVKKYPLGYGESEDVANPIIFLLSPASKWMTGQNLILDGGRTTCL